MDASQAFWALALVVVFLAMLIVPAAIFESRIGRDWIKRLQGIEQGRARQQAEWIETHTWRGPR